jgi:hypothetical protein
MQPSHIFTKILDVNLHFNLSLYPPSNSYNWFSRDLQVPLHLEPSVFRSNIFI